MVVKFLRNKVVEVEPRKDGTLGVSWRLTDDLLKMEVNLVVQPPALEIIEAAAELGRFVPKGLEDASEIIEDVEGVNIGAGLRKIVRGVLGGPEGQSLLSEAVLECCNAVILHFTRPGLEIGEALETEEERLEAVRAMVKSSPRLVRSCISFQDDSPIMKGLDL
ncbi:DUF2889 domain-containing protein [Desulfatibacillum aliphaticivorans]|uniref:Uncharacterized protein n=1 Tax=Desulfatibacillum aliphaticivorans TaxID=218208 RepID=B8FE03_DESAL|nr:DUF2889 domain-containing protein [Desulfatibacillum aliphaticivorans]ACL06784.1 hypothetical protein Dalk_5113 [Desulfatibacillum aliphaticivorans]